MISRNKYILIYCWLWLLFFLVRLSDGLCLFCLDQAFLYDLRQDPILWIGQYFDIPRLVVKHQIISLLFDIALPTIIITILLRSDKRNRKLWLTFIILFWFYLLVILSFPSLSLRKYLGLAIVPLLFVIPNKHYQTGLAYLRYYCLFIFSSSALWKILRGSIFESDHFYNILRSQHFSNFVRFPDHWISKLNLYLLDHPSFISIAFLLVVVSQLSFVVGFFTRRFDKVLMSLMIVFVLMDYAIMRIEYWEFAILLPLLWQAKQEVDDKP